MINFESRLKSLKDRRQGALERATLQKMALNEAMGLESLSLDGRKQETYEGLSQSAAIKYTIGAMSEVEEASTNISINEGTRVAETLQGMLETAGVPTYIEMQGSVPLNIHIKKHSDVDMLMLIKGTVLVQTPSPDESRYSPATDKRSMRDIVKELRMLSEEKLTTRYPEVHVDCSNAKSIAMSGGSLKRKVDIVPSCWFDTIEYQLSGKKHDRGVKILDKKADKLIGNSPFKHIKLVNDKDAIYNGNLKKCVRLIKNLIADMPDYKKSKAKKLSSFDIVGIVYNMNDLLSASVYTPLALVNALRIQFENLKLFEAARDIKVPDGSRKVFDSEEKIVALGVVCDEILALSEALNRDIAPESANYKPDHLTEKVIYF
ncbi:hypothetical protein [Vibrio parahaemolyticus]|uniref:hypothetical protein n=1 Tax=Vibrio parahaemolyticus TaxID=670 RepID=UPI0004DABF90|nr:hypothetical protein [Vibrio parahaemolyticus]ODX40560.1 hypothetical protein BBM04_21635 [Vibrio parahaemolyticus]ODY92923.1 hypothetical protein BBM33_13330 [Vibrio parahaemolyticus]OQT01702.1 hypothetical protein EM58_014490 [Vibrio parahaemolyticus 98-513-F52]PNO30135.1 hypothetical protein RK52_006960 [Vibrio parahaemolyticus]